MTPKLRVARPSDDLEALLRFYRDGLGLTLIGRFDDHQGFDGIILGDEGARYHFEFTHQRGHLAGCAPSQDHLVVFYLPDETEWRKAADRMRDAGFAPVRSLNPYWDLRGVTFEDPDGYRVVLQNAAWGRLTHYLFRTTTHAPPTLRSCAQILSAAPRLSTPMRTA